MNNYKKLKCVQGLIVGLEEQIYRLKNFKELDKEKEEVLVNEYFNAVKEIVNEETS